MDRIYILLYKIFAYPIKKSPPLMEELLVQFFGNLFALLDSRRGRVAKINLDFAYGDTLPQKSKEQIVKACYKNLVRNFIIFLKTQSMSREQLLKSVEFKNSKLVDALLEKGEKIIFLTSHFGSWELGSLATTAKYQFDVTVIGRRLGIDALDVELEKSRARFGIEMLDKNGAMKGMVKALKNGRHIGILVDQNCADSEGILVDFFGKKTRHTHVGSILARKFDATIVFMYTKRERGAITVTYEESYKIEKSDDVQKDIFLATQKQAEVAERYIREAPHEWFWFHRRWKNQYEEIYPK